MTDTEQADVDQLAALLRQRSDWADEAQMLARVAYRHFAPRLLPAKYTPRVEWAVWWHAGDDDAICMDAGQLTSPGEAEQLGASRLGEYNLRRYTLHWREHRCYPDGQRWSGPWRPYQLGIQLKGLARGGRTPQDGRWLVEYDPTRPGIGPGGQRMNAHIVTSQDKAQARRFGAKLDAFQYWQAESGRPAPQDRPLTAYTVAIEPLETPWEDVLHNGD